MSSTCHACGGRVVTASVVSVVVPGAAAFVLAASADQGPARIAVLDQWLAQLRAAGTDEEQCNEAAASRFIPIPITPASGPEATITRNLLILFR